MSLYDEVIDMAEKLAVATRDLEMANLKAQTRTLSDDESSMTWANSASRSETSASFSTRANPSNTREPPMRAPRESTASSGSANSARLASPPAGLGKLVRSRSTDPNGWTSKTTLAVIWAI